MQADGPYASMIARAGACADYPAFRDAMMDLLAGIGWGSAWGVYALDRGGEPLDVAVHGLPDGFVDRYEEVGRRLDPVRRAVVELSAPVHNLVGLTVRQWHQEPLYQHVSAPHGLEHFLTMPILDEDGIALTIHVGRGPTQRPFEQRDLLRAAALATRLSLLHARVRARWSGPRLTERELEVAQMVAKGLTNREAARCLAISSNTIKATLKRVFAKLQVDSRTEMAWRLRGSDWS